VRVLDVLSREEAGADEIAGVLRLDPAFGAQVLRLANSAAYGAAVRIASLAEAVLRLGTERLRALVMTVGLSLYLRGVRKQQAHRACWQHSVACAFVAEEIGATCGLGREHAYTAGLLHDVGRLALLVGYPRAYADLVAASRQGGLALLEAERAMFDVDHCEAGLHLARDWGFPEALCEVIARHHDEPPPAGLTPVAVVSLACRLTDALGFRVATPERLWSLDEVREHLPEVIRRCWHPDLAELARTTTGKVEAVGEGP
jgi:putative nucleotidyltransferase with HDIG domain